MNRRSAESAASGSSRPRKRTRVNDEIQMEKDVSSSSSNSISDAQTIPKLPVEVVAHIFKFMSLRERLNASLVCQEWHEAGSYPIFSCNEKLVIRGCQNSEELLWFLYRYTKRKTLNLEFRDCKLCSHSNLFMLEDKIRYLSLMDCEICISALVDIFVNCTHLNEFNFNEDHRIRCVRPSLSCFGEKFVQLLEVTHSQFVNENLTTFSLAIVVTDMTPRSIQSLFKMFPNITRLTFRVSLLTYYIDDNPYQEEFKFSSVIQEIISLKNSLQQLKVYAYEPQLRSLALHDFTRLKEITITVKTDLPDSLMFDFFSRQKCLERISCSSVLSSSFPTRFFQHLITHCSNLKHLKLKFRISCTIDLSPELFRALLSSKLISLKIRHSNIRPTSDQLFTTSMNFPENTTLRVLRIPVVIDHRIQSLFVQSFKRLKFLELQCFSGMVLESIGKFQTNLTTFKLILLSREPHNMSDRFIDPTSKWCLYQVENCLQSLTCLENLGLYFEGRAPQFDCKFVPFSVKYLRICFAGYHRECNSDTDRNLIFALKEKTGLEGIYFSQPLISSIDLSIWLEICSSLNKLRILGLNCETSRKQKAVRPSPSLEAFTTFFDHCPSLRYFSRKIFDKDDDQFAYDYVERKMKKVSRMFCNVTTGKIADSKIQFSPMYVWGSDPLR